MSEAKVGRHQQKALDAERVAEETVMSTISVLGVPYEGMRGMCEVPAYLMVAAGMRKCSDERVAPGLVFADRCVELDEGLTPELGERLVGILSSFTFKRVIEGTVGVDEAADHGEISFLDTMSAKKL